MIDLSKLSGSGTLRNTALAAAAVMALTFGGMASAAGPVKSTATAGVAGKAVKAERVSPLAVLYDQNDNDAGNAITSQDFEASFDQYDNQSADDFIVPAGVKWTVSVVNVSGAYYNGAGLMPAVRVTFYKNKKGKPGAVVKDYPSIVPTDNGTGSLSIALPSKVALVAGKYWLSVQAIMDFGAGGQWGWEVRSLTANTAPKWQNPLDGFGSGCLTWSDMGTCIGSSTPDLMFSLQGKSKPV